MVGLNDSLSFFLVRKPQAHSNAVGRMPSWERFDFFVAQNLTMLLEDLLKSAAPLAFSTA